MGEVASITIGHRRQDVFPVVRRLERDFCDPREFFPDRILVFGVRCPEFMKIDLLIKI